MSDPHLSPLTPAEAPAEARPVREVVAVIAAFNALNRMANAMQVEVTR